MKRRLIPFAFLLLAIMFGLLQSSCHSAKKAARAKLKQANEEYASTNSSGTTTSKNSSTHTSGKSGAKSKKHSTTSPANEGGIAAKYASLLGVSKSDITNTDLYNFIDLWYGTPYKWAGRSRSGVDCSDFSSLLEKSIYDITISGTCTDMYKSCKPIKPSQLREGDLVFFKINSKILSHMGVYLQNNRFVHASTHAGVVISNLGDDYYKKYFWGAGRLK